LADRATYNPGNEKVLWQATTLCLVGFGGLRHGKGLHKLVALLDRVDWQALFEDQDGNRYLLD